MTELENAALMALEALDEIHSGKRHPQLALAVAHNLRKALTQALATTEQEKAMLDALVCGTGFLVDGRRVDPASVSFVTTEPEDDAQIRAIGEGLRSAHDHIEMHKLERSHCKDAARIREGLAAFAAYKKRGDFVATTERKGEPVAYFVTWPGDPVGMRRFYGADEWEASRKTVEYFGGVSRPLIFGDTSPQVPEGFALVKSPITEAMHTAACKVLTRSTGLDGLPQRMLDAMIDAARKGE